MTRSSVRIVFWGTSDFAVPILEAIAASPWRPVLVVSTPDRPAGRGQKLVPPPVKAAAVRIGIPVEQPETLKSGRWLLGAAPYDLFIVASYGKILPKALLQIPHHGALNVHPSLLPRWRGPAPIQFTILEGDRETGVTIIRMDEEMDHGPIVAQVRIQHQESKIRMPELQRKLAELGAKLLLETIPKWLSGEIMQQPQDHANATYCRILTREDGHIRWHDPADRIERMTRAFDPWPGAYTFWQRNGNRVRLNVEDAEVLSGRVTDTAPGAVLGTDAGITVATGSGVLRIIRLKPEGGHSMDASAFARGHREILNAVLT